MTSEEFDAHVGKHDVSSFVALARHLFADYYTSAPTADACLLDQLVTANTQMSLLTAMPDEFKRLDPETANRLLHAGADRFAAARTAVEKCTSFRRLPAKRQKEIDRTYFLVMAMDKLPPQARQTLWTQGPSLNGSNSR